MGRVVFWAEGNTAPEEEENDMKTKTHLSLLVSTLCGRKLTATIKASADMSGVDCKNCLKKVDSPWHTGPQNGETPSLEEIAEEAPLPVPVIVQEMREEVATAATASEILTREAWLILAVDMLSKIFEAQGFKVPPVRISVGWPGGKSKKGLHTTIGQCWYSASDKVPQIFISPNLIDTTQILETIMHELVHAVDGGKSMHKAGFKRIAVLVGLEGKMTATHAGATLRAVFPKVLEALGTYDHAKLDPGTLIARVQTNKHLKIQCPACGFASRATQKQLDAHGISQHCGEDMAEA